MSIELGDPEDVVAELRALVAEHPYRERLRLHLMRALHVADRTAEALDCYADVRRGLAEDLGLEPCAELQQLQRRILDGRPAAPRTEAWRRPPQPPAQLPPAPHLIGREDELTELDGLLDPGRATLRVLTGGVGTGKTALALAWAHRAAGHFPDGLLFARLRGCATRAGAGGRGAAPVPHRAGRAVLGISRQGGRQQLNQPLGGDWPAGISARMPNRHCPRGQVSGSTTPASSTSSGPSSRISTSRHSWPPTLATSADSHPAPPHPH